MPISAQSFSSILSNIVASTKATAAIDFTRGNSAHARPSGLWSDTQEWWARQGSNL